MRLGPLDTPRRRAFSSSVFCRFDKQVLLIRHKRLGLWLPVGGELETRLVDNFWNELETPLEAAAREVREETGFEPVFPRIRFAPAGTPPGFLGYEEHDAGDKGLHMNFCFLAEVFERVPKSDGSWTDYQWVNPVDVQGDKSLEMPENVRDVLWQIALTRVEVP